MHDPGLPTPTALWPPELGGPPGPPGGRAPLAALCDALSADWVRVSVRELILADGAADSRALARILGALLPGKTLTDLSILGANNQAVGPGGAAALAAALAEPGCPLRRAQTSPFPSPPAVLFCFLLLSTPHPRNTAGNHDCAMSKPRQRETDESGSVPPRARPQGGPRRGVRVRAGGAPGAVPGDQGKGPRDGPSLPSADAPALLASEPSPPAAAAAAAHSCPRRRAPRSPASRSTATAGARGVFA